jgi:diguanylate cyclase (GGDEF)-like protein
VYPAESTIGIQFKDLPCLKGLSTIAEIWTSCQLNRGWSGDVASINKSGQSYCRHLTIDPICDSYATVTNYIIKFYDISDRKRLEGEILYQTQYDEATNLPNRRFLYKVLQNLIYDSSPNQFVLLFIDVDRFKQINDTYGHNVGDMFLQQFAANMRNCVRTTDFVSRYAGDEFIVILKGIVPSTVRSAITKIFNELTSQPIAIGDICIDVRVSVGVVMYPEGGTTEDSLISHADTAMYQAKGHGRCQVYYYNNDSEHTEDYRLENALVRSIRTHGMSDFYLVYQPQVRLDTRVMTGGEALLRWTNPEGKLVPPSEFIPILESNNNMIIEVGEWVLRQACTDFKDLIDYTVCVNVSLKQLRHFNFVDMVTRVLFETGFDPLRLELEVTESLFIADNVGLSKMLMELVGMGIKISIDDFGTGYSSLSRLINLPITKLKIDGLFMQSFEDNPHSKQVIHTIVQIGKDLNLTVLAEGVETKDQVDYLMSTGCGFVQGYYFSRPISLEAFKAFGLNSLKATMPTPSINPE